MPFHRVYFLFKVRVFWDKLDSVQNVRGWGWAGLVMTVCFWGNC